MARRDDEITIEDVKIIFRNFAGREDTYNRRGDRNFCVLLTPNLAELFRSKGWNVKMLRAREDGEIVEEQPYLKVNVKFGDYPPRIIMLTSKGRTALTEDLVDMLDAVEVDTVDMTLSPYKYEIRGESGVSAYLKTMYIKIIEDPLDAKYAEYEITED